MATRRVKDYDKGWKGLVRRVNMAARGAHVEVGILGEEADKIHKTADGHESSITIGEIGEVHEFGLGNNPVRSWLRGYVDANAPGIKERMRRVAKQVAAGKMTQQEALALVGMSIKGGIQKRIAEGIQPQVTRATQKRKGPSKTIPLINSGQFRSSINYKVEAGKV